MDFEAIVSAVPPPPRASRLYRRDALALEQPFSIMQADCYVPVSLDKRPSMLLSIPLRRQIWPDWRHELAGILWLVLVVLVVLWLLGLIANIGGGLIHILIVAAVIILIYNLLTSRNS